MKKLIVILSMLLFVVSPLAAAEYKSKEFPSADIIKKNLSQFVAKDNFDIGDPVGKYKTADGIYKVYVSFIWKHGSRIEVQEVILIHLDTDKWILKWKDNGRVLEQ